MSLSAPNVLITALFQVKINTPGRTINLNQLTIPNKVEHAGRVNNCRDAVFARNNGPVRKQTSSFQHQPARQWEDRRPARISPLRDQYFPPILPGHKVSERLSHVIFARLQA